VVTPYDDTEYIRSWHLEWQARAPGAPASPPACFLEKDLAGEDAGVPRDTEEWIKVSLIIRHDQNIAGQK